MRYILLAILMFLFVRTYSQQSGKTQISAIVVDADSIPIPNVAIICARTGKTVRTNAKGFFQTEISADDSLFIHHISYKWRFANEKDNGKLIILEPEIHELKQFKFG
jgi:hypothetical protein